MMKLGYIGILGTPYSIHMQTESENPKLKTAYGLCETYAKKIILLDDEPSDNVTDDNFMYYENYVEFKTKSLRHEIVHAFLAESGLRNNSEWAENEEMVDWIAIQIEKMYPVMQQAEKLLMEHERQKESDD